jgi:hypothetical protein
MDTHKELARHGESIDQEDIEVFRNIYEQQIHQEFSGLYRNHVKPIPSEWKSSSFIRIRDFLDDYLTDIFCVRFGFSLLRLRINPKQFELRNHCNGSLYAER